MKLNSKIYQDSKVAAEVSCGRTKCETIVTNVLGEKRLAVVITDNLKPHDPWLFFGIQTDASNHENMKRFPVSVQYFSLEHGTVTYIIDFFQNAVGMFTCLKNFIDNLQLDWKKNFFLSADNANCNFREKHSLYTNVLTRNDDIIKG